MHHLLFLLAVTFFASCSPAPTVQVPPGPPALPAPKSSPNIFKRYSTQEDAILAKGWTRNIDMSGVSFNRPMTATLVTQRHVVMAFHYRRKVGEKLVFHNREGKRAERILIAVKKVVGDVAVGMLNEDLPRSFKAYPLPSPGRNYDHLVGKTALVSDQNRRLFCHEVSRVSTEQLGFRHPTPAQYGWSKKLISGDSGNPSFIISGNELVLIETHTFGGAGSGPFYGSPTIQKTLQSIIKQMSPGYKLRFRKI